MQYESPITSGEEVIAKVKVYKSRLNFKVKVTRPKLWYHVKKPCHKEYTCVVLKPYHFW